MHDGGGGAEHGKLTVTGVGLLAAPIAAVGGLS